MPCATAIFSNKLRELEDIVRQKKESLTLLGLSVELHPMFRDVDLLRHMVTGGLGTDEPGMPGSSRTSVVRFLDRLWHGLRYCHTLGEGGASSVQLLFPLWVMSIRPYLTAVGEWMARGVLQDRHGELCIVRNEAVIEGAGNYWGEGFSVRDPVPQFLEPLLDQVMLAGKSMNLIDTTGQRRGGEEEEDETDVPLELRDMDPLLQQYLQSLTCHAAPDGPTSLSVWNELRTMAGRQSNTPVNVLVQNCLQPLISKLCKKVRETTFKEVRMLHCRFTPVQSVDQASSCLMHILHTEYNLLDHFRTVQLFLLMEAGDTMHHFASDIFSRIQRGEPWRDGVYLNSLLQEVLLPHYPHLDNWSRGRLRQSSPAPVMKTYNAIFHFLMQVKWAKWCLEGLQVKGHMREAGTRTPLSLLLHRLLLLRAKLLHFVNSIYHYLMTRILHSVGLKFQGQVNEAADLDTVLTLHSDYVSTIFDRCLLNKKVDLGLPALFPPSLPPSHSHTHTHTPLPFVLFEWFS
ncbi:Gamma-tubulin complex component 5 (Fragment) [Geodia barretti]|uniref:Gamma-tubulin complex component n=1 Tax=Geodia barretti TaxID=519541 RepID=A0AA35S424_GEOBA